MLVDTSVWVGHFRHGDPTLAALLEDGAVWCHPFVIGELACGLLSDRERILSLMEALPRPPEAEHGEVMGFVDQQGLAGTGIGWIDAHLLASARLGGLRLWTRDRPLSQAARRLGMGFEPSPDG